MRRGRKVRAPRLLHGSGPDTAVRAPGPPEPAVFDALVERYQRVVFRYVFHLVRDFHLTQDLSQEVFLKVYRRFHTYDARHLLSTWLLRVAHNHTVDYLRQRRLPTVSMEAAAPGSEVPLRDALPGKAADAAELVVDRAQGEAVERTIEAMPLEHRSVLLLRFAEGRSYEEISFILGVPKGTVKSRINRARAHLQRSLARRGEL